MRCSNDREACFFFKPEPPSFIKKIEDVTTLSGDAVTFQAVVRGSAPISVTWMKGTDIIKEDNKVKVTFEDGIATLHISDVQISSGGKYTCLAENDAGSQTCFGQLAIKGQCRNIFDITRYFILPGVFAFAL